MSETIVEVRPSHYTPTRLVARNITVPLRQDPKTGEVFIAPGRDPERVKYLDYDKKSLLVFKVIR